MSDSNDAPDATAVLNGLLEWLNTNATTAGHSTSTIYDLYNNANPFNLATRLGLQAMNDAFAPLVMDDIDKWDGDVITFPDLILSLTERYEECNWDAPDSSRSRIHCVIVCPPRGDSCYALARRIEDAEVPNVFTHTKNHLLNFQR